MFLERISSNWGHGLSMIRRYDANNHRLHSVTITYCTCASKWVAGLFGVGDCTGSAHTPPLTAGLCLDKPSHSSVAPQSPHTCTWAYTSQCLVHSLFIPRLKNTEPTILCLNQQAVTFQSLTSGRPTMTSLHWEKWHRVYKLWGGLVGPVRFPLRPKQKQQFVQLKHLTQHQKTNRVNQLCLAINWALLYDDRPNHCDLYNPQE